MRQVSCSSRDVDLCGGPENLGLFELIREPPVGAVPIKVFVTGSSSALMSPGTIPVGNCTTPMPKYQ
jgi:hypothetical protein